MLQRLTKLSLALQIIVKPQSRTSFPGFSKHHSNPTRLHTIQRQIPAMSPAFLLIGLGWEELEKIVPKDQLDATRTRLLDALAQGERQSTDKGYEYKLINYGPEENMERLKSVLGSEVYDGVCMSNAQYTPLFENLVNTVCEHSPRSKLLFNTTPTNTIEAVERWFP